MPPFLHIDGLTKRFGTLTVLDDVALEVEQGEVLALLGPSGSGKTTMLRILAGFETADAGTLTVDGREVGGLPAAQRGFGMVFQHYALFPHLTVAQNVSFGLETGKSRPGRGEIASRVDEMLALVDLDGFGPRPIDELSGGQQQRVALARALAPGPRLLLLDEPLSNLDPALRERTRREIRKTVEQVGITTVLVTHEQDEAFHLGDRVAVLHEGKLEQVGPPEELYLEPASRFVAGFVGRSSNLDGRLEGGRVRLGDFGEVSWPAELGDLDGTPDGTPVVVAARPESLRLAPVGATDSIEGRVTGRRYAGLVTYFLVDLAGTEVEVLDAPDAARVGDAVAVTPRRGASGLAGEVPALRAYPVSGASR